VESANEVLRPVMEGAAFGVEVLAVGVIVIAIAYGTVRFLMGVGRAGEAAYRAYKENLTKALLLGLEFLVAADIVRTVAIETTLTNVAILAALVVVRTFLSWSLVVEMEGRWPWQGGNARITREES
jgi:uncharacterized membrane protein